MVPMAKGGRYLSVKKPKRKGGKIFLIVLLVLVLLIAAVAAGGMIYYNSMLSLITRPETTENSLSDADLEAILGYVPEKETTAETEAPTETTAAPTEPAEDPILNIMLIGQNYRKGEEHKLSDTLILCSINKDTKTITLTSFLRDLYVKLPNYKGHVCGWNRINVAYNLGWRWAGELGGMEMLDTLLYDSFGVKVDYNVEVGFETFTQIIDILGGVDIELTGDEARYISTGRADGRRFTAGMNHLDGEAALTYSRIRSANAGDNDFNRTDRQRKLLVSLFNKAKTMSIPELNGLLQEALPLIITDMTNEEITACAMELLPMLTELTIETNQCPADGTYWGDMIKLGGLDASVIKCEFEPNKEMMMQIAEGIAPTEPAETTAE